MSDVEEMMGLAKRVEAGVLGVFVNDRTTFLGLMDEKSVLVSAGSKVFNGRAAYESWPLNPPGIVARNVTFSPLYSSQPDEAISLAAKILTEHLTHCVLPDCDEETLASLEEAIDQFAKLK